MAIRYECRDCKRIVTGSAYRATCPRCGGMLVNRKRQEKAS